MKLIKYLLGNIAYALLSLTQPVFAEEAVEPIKQEQSKLNFSLRTDLLSRYMFRGFTYSEGPVAQLTPTATYGNMSLIGFANYDTGLENFNETDLTIDFTKPVKNIRLSAGYTYLKFVNTGANDTQEVYATASLDTLLNPTLKIIHDFGDVNGTYIEATLCYDFDKIPLSVTALLAYNNHFLRKESGFSHVELRVAVPLKITGKLTINPMLNCSYALDKTNLENMLSMGIGFNISF
jgi:hypothetical protein